MSTDARTDAANKLAGPSGGGVDERLPAAKTATFAIQHLLIMYAGAVAVPLAFGAAMGLDQATIAMLVNADLLVCGIITIIQSLGVGRILGARLPIIGGATFIQLAPLVAIGQEYGLHAVWGCMLAGGIVGMLLAYPFSLVIRYFPPLVTGSVLVVVGVSLISVAGGLIVGNNPELSTYGQPSRIFVGAVVMAVALAFTTLMRGFWAQAGLLVSIVIGILVSWPLGLLNFAGVGPAHWFGVVTPFHFGAPAFPIAGVISCSIVMAVVFAESLASVMALAEITGKPLTRGDIARALAADGLSGVLGGIMNSFYDTIFNQNVGAVRTTGVHSRYVTAVSGALLVVMGFVPKMGAVVASLPGLVVGGAALVLFGTIAVVGIPTLRKGGLHDSVNATIVATAISLGLLPRFMEGMFEHFPDWSVTILSDGIVLAAITAFVLNLVFNHTSLATLPQRDESVRLAHLRSRPRP